MKCPLPSFYRSWPSGEIALKKEDCLKEECAWWDENRLCCEYRSTRIELSRLVERLDEIINKMPHEE